MVSFAPRGGKLLPSNAACLTVSWSPLQM